MDLHLEPLTLTLATPFRIAHGTSTERHNVLIRIRRGEHEGLGEAAPVRQHNETQAAVLDYLSALPPLPADPFLLETILSGLPAGSRAAQAAVDIALHDLVGKELGLPLYRLFGLDPSRAPQTSFTIGLGSIAEVQAKACSAAGHFSILKLKFDGDADHCLATARAVRAVTEARLVADANCAWTVEQALRLLPALAQIGLEWIEQPLPEADLEGLQRIHHASPVPIFADEPVRTARDIPPLAGCVDGVNIKVMKAGGLREAWRMIAVARAHGLQVMLGCMVETSVGVTAAAHLAPLADWLDLDGMLHIRNDPFVGVEFARCGELVLPDRPGLGIIARHPVAHEGGA
ncbi:MAG: dipeptide epimerase [Anaerolineae bacterium]|jgi:L-alanine-DL-glutamate epimerase-like enolase superfamily enzyme